jgi:hypothetical protein
MELIGHIMPQLLYYQGEHPQYLLNSGLGWVQNWCGCFEKEKNLFLFSELSHYSSNIHCIAY